jgi:hypothetical protein
LHQQIYPYDHNSAYRYVFTSLGKKQIRKIVTFEPTSLENVYNIGFGDLLENGSFDDKAISNNGDISKVLATVIHIIRKFAVEHRHLKIMFLGSSPVRTILYKRIIKTYYALYSKEFLVSAFIKRAGRFEEVKFDPESEQEYLVFFIKRIN